MDSETQSPDLPLGFSTGGEAGTRREGIRGTGDAELAEQGGGMQGSGGETGCDSGNRNDRAAIYAAAVATDDGADEEEKEGGHDS